MQAAAEQSSAELAESLDNARKAAAASEAAAASASEMAVQQAAEAVRGSLFILIFIGFA
jgi:uncharacterized metal-binding protein